MSTYSQVTIVGKITKKGITMRYSQAGKPIADFTVFTTDSKKVGDSWDNHNNYFDVTAFDKTAQYLADYIQGGALVIIGGSLKMDEWTDSVTGKKRTAVTINANTVKEIKPPKDTGDRPETREEGHKAVEEDAPF